MGLSALSHVPKHLDLFLFPFKRQQGGTAETYGIVLGVSPQAKTTDKKQLLIAIHTMRHWKEKQYPGATINENALIEELTGKPAAETTITEKDWQKTIAQAWNWTESPEGVQGLLYKTDYEQVRTLKGSRKYNKSSKEIALRLFTFFAQDWENKNNLVPPCAKSGWDVRKKKEPKERTKIKKKLTQRQLQTQQEQRRKLREDACTQSIRNSGSLLRMAWQDLLQPIAPPAPPKEPAKDIGEQTDSESDSEPPCITDWSCPACTFPNKERHPDCIICRTSRDEPPKATDWECPCCTYANEEQETVCTICKTNKDDKIDYVPKWTIVPQKTTLTSVFKTLSRQLTHTMQNIDDPQQEMQELNAHKQGRKRKKSLAPQHRSPANLLDLASQALTTQREKKRRRTETQALAKTAAPGPREPPNPPRPPMTNKVQRLQGKERTDFNQDIANPNIWTISDQDNSEEEEPQPKRKRKNTHLRNNSHNQNTKKRHRHTRPEQETHKKRTHHPQKQHPSTQTVTSPIATEPPD